MPLTTRGTRIFFFFGIGLGCGCCGMSCLPVRLDSLSPWERVGERAYATPLFFLFKCYVRGILMRIPSLSALRGGQRCFKNPRIGAAAAKISLACFTDLGERRMRITLQVRGNCGDESRRAKAAHQGVTVDKSLLHVAHVFRRAEPFDRR